MAKKFLLVLIVAIALLILGLVLSLSDSGSTHKASIPTNQNQQAYEFKYDFPIEKRAFLIGTAGYIPSNFNDPSLSDVVSFWDDTDSSSEVYGVHTKWSDTKLVEAASKNTQTDLVLLMGMQTPSDWERVDEIKEAIRINLESYPQIKYLGVGNEINLIKEAYLSEFAGF